MVRSLELLADGVGGSVCAVDTRRPFFHLSFDDGPHPEVTPRILEVLDEYRAPATFFVLMKHVDRYPDVLAETLRRGHQVGLHGRTHLRLSTASWRAITREVARAQDELTEATGRQIELFRPPYGDHGWRSLAMSRRRGMRTVLWSVDSYDWKGIREHSPLGPIVARIQRGGIGLIHDTPIGKTVAEESRKGLIRKEEIARAVLEGSRNRGLEAVSLGTLLASGREIRRFRPAQSCPATITTL